MLIDPVCGKLIEPRTAHAVIHYHGTSYYLCCPLCQTAFEREPAKYAGGDKDAMTQTAQVRDAGTLVYTVTIVAGAK